MEEAYFHTRFRVPVDASFPLEFAIISAYATTGQVWSAERNEEADQRLRARLAEFEVWLERVEGYSPTTRHSEPSWAVAIPFDLACAIGTEFHQDAIYYVTQGYLQVAQCQIRAPEHVDSFLARVDYGTY